MSDRIPGTTWDNPIWHRDWRIYLDDRAGTSREGYAFTHDDYDGAPTHSDEGPADNRHGWEPTIEAAKAAIDEFENEAAATAFAAPFKSILSAFGVTK